jgi:hypothetical protein
MTYAIYRTDMGIRFKEAIRTGYLSLDEAVAAFTALKGETIAILEKDEDGHEAYDAVVIRGPVMETYAIEAFHA